MSMIDQTPIENKPIRLVTVYAASSGAISPVYVEGARRLGGAMAEAGLSVVYGGGSTGLMGAMADAMLENGGPIREEST